MTLRRTLHTTNRNLDALVAGTPPDRDRYIDFLRVFAIGVVVAWHWSLSIVAWTGDRWVMPNPIHTVPAGWAATWLLQIMPVFFLVGGYANGAAWWAARRDQHGLAGYYARRLRRLLVPIGVFVLVWAVFELIAWRVVPGYSGLWAYGRIVLAPLWFVIAYVWVVMLTPATASAHRRAPWLTVGLLAAGVCLADLGRFSAGWQPLGWVNTALVWVLVHQLGYFYRDGTLARGGRPLAVALLAGGLAVLAGLTSLPAYPRSMVATVGQERSNILPTTLAIVAVAVIQLGVILMLKRPLGRLLRRPTFWKPVVAGNAVILTIFLWHMTALVVVLATLHAVGLRPGTEPTAGWWLQRPLWLLAPTAVLAVLVAIFGRFERTRVSHRLGP